MSLMQQLCAKGTAFAAVIAVGTLSSGSAQAAIVMGAVTGTWNYDYGLGTSVTVGDTFKATYTYDDAALTPFIYYDNGHNKTTGLRGSLLSLIVESGTYNYTFNLPKWYQSSSIEFHDFAGNPDYGNYSDYESSFKYFVV